ncbi:MAG: GNAT family N-acetyltransferase [Limisphaerales bacterium]
MKPFPVLRTNRLVLREIRTEDRAEVFSIYSNPEVTRFCDMVTLTDSLHAGEVIRVLQADWEKDSGARWAITRQGSPRLIGICGLGWHRHNYSALLSYDLNQEFWNQRIMTEAVTAVVGYAFGQAWLNRITAITVLDNPGSLKVLQHLGFQEEGVLRDWGFWRGSFKDVRCLSLLRRDAAAPPGPTTASRNDVRNLTGFLGDQPPCRLVTEPCRHTPAVDAPRGLRASSAVGGHPQG